MHLKIDIGENSNISGLIGSISSQFLLDKGTEDYSLVNILLIDFSIFIDLSN